MTRNILSGPSIAPTGGGAPQSIVILLHGLGDSGQGLIELGHIWCDLLPHTLFMAPNAPFPCQGMPFGFQWFGFEDLRPQSLYSGICAAAPYLDQFIDSCIAEYKVPPERIALAGFSQGAIMSLHVAPRRSSSLAGVIAYSGALVNPTSLKKEALTTPPILLVHGCLDAVVPFSALAEAEKGLQEAGLSPRTIARPHLGHSIDDEGLRAGGYFLKQVLLEKT